jgi:hypothetical protein
MDGLKKVLGIVWLALAALLAYLFIFILGVPKVISGSQDDLVFGIIILAVLTPIIVVGMALFGYYSLVGEYSDDKM